MSKNKNQNPKPATDATLPAGQPVPSGDATATPAPATGKRRGRKSLSEADKANMQAGRIVASEEKEKLALVLADAGITDPEVFTGVPAFQFDAIAGVVKGVKAVNANAKMAVAKAQYEAACKASGSTPDATLMAAAPTVKTPKTRQYSEDEKAALAKARATVTNGLTLGLLSERISDARIWSDLPAAKLEAMAAVIEAKTPAMNDQRIAEAKAMLEAVLADTGKV